MNPAAPLRRFPLRTRLTLLTAVAVAVAVACWLLTREQLRDELDTTLQNIRVPPGYLADTVRNCRDTDPPTDEDVLPGIASGQVVAADGKRCVGPNSQPVEVAAEDAEVAAGVREEALRDGSTEDGKAVRVLTKRVADRPGLPGYAVSVSRPLSEIDGALDTLALLLTAVAGVGVLGAATAGCRTCSNASGGRPRRAACPAPDSACRSWTVRSGRRAARCRCDRRRAGARSRSYGSRELRSRRRGRRAADRRRVTGRVRGRVTGERPGACTGGRVNPVPRYHACGLSPVAAHAALDPARRTPPSTRRGLRRPGKPRRGRLASPGS